jgi:hypothetical protein
VPVESWRRAGPGLDGQSVARCLVASSSFIGCRIGAACRVCLLLSPLWGSRLYVYVAYPSLRGLAAAAVGRLAFLKSAIG